MTNTFSIAHIHTTGPNTDRDFIIQLGILPLDGKNNPVIQRFHPECGLSRSAQERSGLKDKDLENELLFGSSAVDWKQIFSSYSTLFVMKTGNGDEIEWINKILLDHEIDTKVIDLTRIIQFFLPNFKGHSLEELYETFNKTALKPSHGLMGETLQLGERMLREIIYLFSRTDTPFHAHLADLMSTLLELPEFNAVYGLVTTCKESGWLAGDLLAQTNKTHDDFALNMVDGADILRDIMPGDNASAARFSGDYSENENISLNAVSNFFGSDFIKKNLPKYEKRDSQVEYARDIARTLNTPLHNYIEAPTGIGKSLGYLVPSALFLEKNPMYKVVIATATKNLQDQVLIKDWPLIKQRFPDLRVAILKGKSNYICNSALARQFNHIFYEDGSLEEKASWIYLALFTIHTDGDLEKIPYHIKQWFDPLKDLIKDVQAHLHCTKSLCKPSGCVYGMHRHEAEQAQIIITNHFKCVLMSESILEQARVVIVDEAERFGDNVRQALSVQIDSWEINRLFYRLKGSTNRRGFIHLIKDRIKHLAKGRGKKAKCAEEKKDIVEGLIASIELAGLELSQFLHEIYPENGRVPALMQQIPELRHSMSALEDGLGPAINSLGAAIGYFKELQEDSVPLNKQYKQRCETYCVLLGEIQERLQEFVKDFMSEHYVHHFKGHPDKSWSFVKIPVKISSILRRTLYEQVDHVVFTSATLYIDNSPHYFISDYGSNSADMETRKNSLPQIFDYQKKAICHIDTSITSYDYYKPEAMELYRNDVNRAISTYALSTNGRTLVLFMSIDELNRSFDIVAPFLQSHDILPLKQNGSSLEEIREFNRNEYSVLFGVDRFWSGVDFPGSTLSQVIITKAPNPALSNPLIAHQKLWDPQFMQEKYPIYGRLRIKQGFGRLIRSINDKGGVIILDSRYEFNPWFSYHLGELPLEVLYTHDQEEIMRSVLKVSGLKKEFHERRIDPFLETEKFPFTDKIFANIHGKSGKRFYRIPNGVISA